MATKRTTKPDRGGARDDLAYLVVRQERDRYCEVACEYACALALATGRCDRSCAQCGASEGPVWCGRVVEEVTGRKTGREAVQEIYGRIRDGVVGRDVYPRSKRKAAMHEESSSK